MSELLKSKLTYHEFCDLMTDAWLEAGDEMQYSPPLKRKATNGQIS